MIRIEIKNITKVISGNVVLEEISASMVSGKVYGLEENLFHWEHRFIFLYFRFWLLFLMDGHMEKSVRPDIEK